MLKRFFLLPVALAAAGGVPFVTMNEDVSSSVQSAVQSVTGGNTTEQADEGLSLLGGDGELATVPEAGSDVAALTTGSVESQGVMTNQYHPRTGHALQVPTYFDLRSVFRFDVTPDWIISQWPRVSTGWIESGYEGFRVPLVTGTTPSDLSGSLTYFFDKNHRVQRIRFVGTTGDARGLAELVTEVYQFKKQPSSHAGLWVRRYNNRSIGVLRVTHSPVVRADQPHANLSVVLEINSTSGAFEMSPTMSEMLETERAQKKW